MSGGPDRAQAREWLEAQIAELRTLRNASTRDSGFKQWRQHTLTLIQRIWAGDPSRPGRFKRIPFTAAGSKPDTHQVQQAYAKGCTEAMTCLRALLKDLDGQDDEAAAAATADAEPKESEPRPARLPDALSKRPARTQRVSDAAVATGQERVLRLVPPPEPEPSDRTRPRETPPLAESDPVAPPLAKKVGPGIRSAANQPASANLPPEQAAAAMPPPAMESRDEAPPRGQQPDGGEDVDPEAMVDLLGSSPVFAAMSRVSRDRDAGPRLSPLALAIAAVATEIESLGVPSSGRALVRAALETLARHDTQPLTWDSLRQSLAVVMEYPDVARRILPLLLPLLDQAA